MYGNELSLTAVLAAAAFLINLIPLESIPFIERDPSISFAYVPSTVSTTILVVISAGIPLVVLVISSAAHAACKRGRSEPTLLRHVVHFLWLLLALAQALLATKLVTDSIKIGVAHPRPNMLAMCDYAGYQAAAASGNFSAYLAATTAGAFGQVSRCAAAASLVKDSQSSFPSGHSSSSFAGMLFLALYFRAVAGVRPYVFFTWPAVLSAAPLVVAIFVAATRVHDRYHATIDVTAGAIVGAFCAWLAFSNYAAAPGRPLFPVLLEQQAPSALSKEGELLARQDAAVAVVDGFGAAGTPSWGKRPEADNGAAIALR